MNQQFPPQSTRNQNITTFLELIGTVIEKRSAIYLSTPITTPKRFRGVESNRTEVQRLVQSLRNKFSRVVINPTALNDLPGWTQDDYRVFWARVIENYADIVVFSDGWQYSNGCAFEFLIAYKNRIQMLDVRQHPLTLDKGIKLITSGINEMQRRNVPRKFLESVKKELLNLKVRNCSKIKKHN